MDLERIREDILENDEKYIVLENGNIVYSSFMADSLNFAENVSLKLIHFINRDTNISIDIAKDKEVKIEEIYYSVKGDVTINTMVVCHENSCLDYLNFEKNDDSKEIKTNVKIYLEDNSVIKNKSITLFNGEVISKQDIYLKGEGAINDSINVIINSSEKTQNYKYDLHHQIKNTTSKMTNYAICQGKSLLNVNTNGIIQKGAKNTNLWQKVKGLLLDAKSMISANPWLQIDEFDCLASHGASIGAIDEEELYYLMSRGLTKEASETLIVEGFINPFLMEIKDEKFQNYIKYWSSKHI
ncbi:MAG: SufD family Fe-S cluster assembly protein [Bacilli bacterium]|nr:SufD family Fe-S cluster assembly protein [Bacilli bacterium]